MSHVHRHRRRRRHAVHVSVLKRISEGDAEREMAKRIERTGRKFDMMYSSDISPKMTKNVLSKFAVLDHQLNGKIHRIYPMKNFDGNSGYVILLHHDCPLRADLFMNNPDKIGQCIAKFHVTSGDVQIPSESEMSKIRSVLTSGEGPNLIDHVVDEVSVVRGDKSPWAPHLSSGDRFSLAHNETTGGFSVFMKTSAKKSAGELVRTIKTLRETRPEVTFLGFLSEYPHFLIHLKNSKRNTMRAMADLCRFLRLKTKLKEDVRAFVGNEKNQSKPLMSVPSHFQYDNIIIPFKGFSPEDYSTYNSAMYNTQYKSRPFVPPKNGSNKFCLALFCGASPYDFFGGRSMRDSRKYVVEINHRTQYASVELGSSNLYCRFMTMPTTMAVTAAVRSPRNIQRAQDCVQYPSINIMDDLEIVDEKPRFKTGREKDREKERERDQRERDLEKERDNEMTMINYTQSGRVMHKSYTPVKTTAADIVPGCDHGASIKLYRTDFTFDV